MEDHPLMRSAVASLLEGSLCAVEVVFAESGKQTLDRLGESPWDLVLLDQNLPDVRGIDLLPKLVGHGPVVFLTSFDSAPLAGLARNHGARGYVSKGARPDQILSVIETVLAGREAFPILAKDPVPVFSPQERRVLEGLLTGKSAVKIAKDLSVTPQTIQSYKDRLCSKLGASSVAELVRIAASKGLG